MRIWYPISVTELDNKRLLGEHNELLIIAKAIKAIQDNTKYGFKNHPETQRWIGHTKALKIRHDQLAEEMEKRGFNHKSPFPEHLINNTDPDNFPTTLWEPLEVMQAKLDEKKRMAA